MVRDTLPKKGARGKAGDAQRILGVSTLDLLAMGEFYFAQPNQPNPYTTPLLFTEVFPLLKALTAPAWGPKEAREFQSGDAERRRLALLSLHFKFKGAREYLRRGGVTFPPVEAALRERLAGMIARLDGRLNQEGWEQDWRGGAE